MNKENKTSGWIQKLQERWGVSASKVIIILIVFALTGFTIMFLKRPVVAFFVGDGKQSLIFGIIYYLLILPIYNLFLLIYGFLLGQFSFFWKFEKLFFRRIFRRNK